MAKVSIDDLTRAEDWLRSYEPAPDEDCSGLMRVADWIKAEILRREDAESIRTIAKQAGVSSAKVRAALKRQAEEHYP